MRHSRPVPHHRTIMNRRGMSRSCVACSSRDLAARPWRATRPKPARAPARSLQRNGLQATHAARRRFRSGGYISRPPKRRAAEEARGGSSIGQAGCLRACRVVAAVRSARSSVPQVRRCGPSAAAPGRANGPSGFWVSLCVSSVGREIKPRLCLVVFEHHHRQTDSPLLAVRPLPAGRIFRCWRVLANSERRGHYL